MNRCNTCGKVFERGLCLCVFTDDEEVYLLRYLEGQGIPPGLLLNLLCHIQSRVEGDASMSDVIRVAMILFDLSEG